MKEPKELKNELPPNYEILWHYGNCFEERFVKERWPKAVKQPKREVNTTNLFNDPRFRLPQDNTINSYKFKQLAFEEMRKTLETYPKAKVAGLKYSIWSGFEPLSRAIHCLCDYEGIDTQIVKQQIVDELAETFRACWYNRYNLALCKDLEAWLPVLNQRVKCKESYL